MFYSQLLLSKKGPLGTVWIAAHCYRKLRKDQVQQTNISSSVDKILDDEVPVVAHRILAYLLLGIVRIYSKKVEYLFDDCNDVLNKLCEFKTVKSKHASIEIGGFLPARHHSVKRPMRFELDAFDLELLEDRDLDGGNFRPPEELMLAVGQGEGSTSGILYKGKMPYPEAYSPAFTPPRDVLSPHHMEQELFTSPSQNMDKSAVTPEKYHETSFSLEDRLEPMVLDEVEEELMHDKLYSEGMNKLEQGTQERSYDSVAGASNNRSDSVLILEKDRGKEQTNDRQGNIRANSRGETRDMEFYIEDEAGEENVEYLRTAGFIEEEPHKCTGFVEKELPVGAKKMKLMETITPASSKRLRTEERPVSITVDITPDSKIAEGGVGTQDIATVRTPAPRERTKILKKHKTLFDSTLMVSNNVYKDWINEPKDLIRKKPIVPQTRLQAWRVHKFCHIPESFVEPLISGMSMDLCYLEHKMKMPAEHGVLSEIKDNGSSPVADVDHRSPVTFEESKQSEVGRHPAIEKSLEDTPVAPGTPVTQVLLNSSRSHETGPVAADSDLVEPMSSHERMEKLLCPGEEVDLDAGFYTEEANSSERNSQENNTYSERTRMAEIYLRKNFLSKKRRKQDEVLNLSRLLSGKTKQESARLFYEILVLKTRDCIDVEQESSYGEIRVRKTSKFQT